MGFLGGSEVKNLSATAGDMDLIPDQEDTLETGMALPIVFLPGESHEQRSLVGYSPWGHKESDMT